MRENIQYEWFERPVQLTVITATAATFTTAAAVATTCAATTATTTTAVCYNQFTLIVFGILVSLIAYRY
jgi:hypothetical protein